MMFDKHTLLDVADLYRSASDLPETTLSSRMFSDGKKLTALRGEADITMGRFNAAMRWMAMNWPSDTPLPGVLSSYLPDLPSDADDVLQPANHNESDHDPSSEFPLTRSA